MTDPKTPNWFDSLIKEGVQLLGALAQDSIEEFKAAIPPDVLAKIKADVQGGSKPVQRGPHPPTSGPAEVILPSADSWMSREEIRRVHSLFENYAGPGEHAGRVAEILGDWGVAAECEAGGP